MPRLTPAGWAYIIAAAITATAVVTAALFQKELKAVVDVVVRPDKPVGSDAPQAAAGVRELEQLVRQERTRAEYAEKGLEAARREVEQLKSSLAARPDAQTPDKVRELEALVRQERTRAEHAEKAFDAARQELERLKKTLATKELTRPLPHAPEAAQPRPMPGRSVELTKFRVEIDRLTVRRDGSVVVTLAFVNKTGSPLRFVLTGDGWGASAARTLIQDGVGNRYRLVRAVGLEAVASEYVEERKRQFGWLTVGPGERGTASLEFQLVGEREEKSPGQFSISAALAVWDDAGISRQSVAIHGIDAS